MLSAKNIEKKFQTNGHTVHVLNNISLNISQGEFVSIVGRSGSGKTTLLNVLSTLVKPDKGELFYGNENITTIAEQRLNQLRRSEFAVIFQFHHLLPYLTALENTLLPFMQAIKPVSSENTRKAYECLAQVGLKGKENRLPDKLSGGEQQRVAIARALVKSSEILFADEPTGSLDKKTGLEIIDLLTDLNKGGLSVVMVTHDPEYAKMANRIIHLEEGKIVSQYDSLAN